MTSAHRSSIRSHVATFFAGCLALALVVGATPAAAQPPDTGAARVNRQIDQGQKIVMATHSFNVFIGPNRRVAGDLGPLARLAAETGKHGHEMLAVQMIGGSTPMQHWNQGDGDETRNIAKVALRKGGVDVFTMSPNARMPEEGIDRFGDLVRETNPNARILVQASWSAWDGTGTTASVGGKGAPTFTNEDHDKATSEQLQAWRSPTARYRVALRTQLEGINQRAGKPVAFVVPSADAVYTLREHILRGEVPGITAQHEIFADAMGHPRAPIVHVVSYVWFAAMYRQSPVGLKALVDANDSASAARELRLQQIAWNAVVAEPMSGVTGPASPFTVAAQPAPETTMTAAERSEAIELLQKSEQELEKAIAGLSDAQWSFKPGPDRWSVGEVVEHIVLADALLFETAIRSLDSAVNPKWEGTLVKTNLIRKAIPDRSRKVDAPAAIKPQQAMTRAALIARFKEQRSKALAYVRDTNKPLKAHTAANPFFGDLNAHQWLLYIPLHHIRHNQQIVEVQASPGYPR